LTWIVYSDYFLIELLLEKNLNLRFMIFFYQTLRLERLLYRKSGKLVLLYRVKPNICAGKFLNFHVAFEMIAAGSIHLKP
jgi:hypothetical protein